MGDYSFFKKLGKSAKLPADKVYFLETFILNGQSIDDYLAKSKKLSKDDEKKFKEYLAYSKQLEKMQGYLEGVHKDDPDRKTVADCIAAAEVLANKVDFTGATSKLLEQKSLAKDLKKRSEERQKAVQQLEKKQQKALEEKRAKEAKAYKERRKENEAQHKAQMDSHEEVLESAKGKVATTLVYKAIGNLTETRFEMTGKFENLSEEALTKFVKVPKEAIRVPEHSDFEDKFDSQMQQALDLLKQAELVDLLEKDDPDHTKGIMEISDKLDKIATASAKITDGAEAFIKANPAGSDQVIQAIRQGLINQRMETVQNYVDQETADAKALLQSLVSWGSPDTGNLQGKLDAVAKIEDVEKQYAAIKDLKVEIQAKAAERYGNYEKEYKEVAKRLQKMRNRFIDICLNELMGVSMDKITRPTADQLLLVDSLLQSRQPSEKNLKMASKMLDEAQKMLDELARYEEFEVRIHKLRNEISGGLGVKDHRKACPALHGELREAYDDLKDKWPSMGLAAAENAFKALRDKVKTGPASFTEKAKAIILWRKDKLKQCDQAKKLFKKLDKKVAELTKSSASKSSKSQAKSFEGETVNELEALKNAIDDEGSDRADVDTRMTVLLTQLRSWADVDTKTGASFDSRGELKSIGSTGKKVKMADHVGAQEMMADHNKGVIKKEADKQLKDNVKKSIEDCKVARNLAKKSVKSKKGKSDLKDVKKQIKQAEKLAKSESYEDALAMIEICKQDIQRATQGIDLKSFKDIPVKWSQQVGKLTQAATTLKTNADKKAEKDSEKKLTGEMETTLQKALGTVNAKAFDAAIKTFDNGDHLRAREEVMRTLRHLRDVLGQDPRLGHADGVTPFGAGLSLDAARTLLDDVERSAIVQT